MPRNALRRANDTQTSWDVTDPVIRSCPTAINMATPEDEATPAAGERFSMPRRGTLNCAKESVGFQAHALHNADVTYQDYEVPGEPDDPEAAALDLIVNRGLQQAEAVLTRSGRTWDPEPLREGLRRFVTALEAEGAFTNLIWEDAAIAASAMLIDIFRAQGQADALLARSHAALAREDDVEWRDRGQAAQAFKAAAKAYPLIFKPDPYPGPEHKHGQTSSDQ